ncbi:hypothetical protein ACH492_08765 [Streptomyces sp. NPDC019443]|uniref:hypothetical protein n=1 Tax=Streptomyces sp. NPDC019443 TaxID=3365061 RepID=UPI0037940639
MELDAMSTSQHVVPNEAAAVIEGAVTKLVATGVAGDGAAVGPDYISLSKIESEERARELAAIFHAAMYGLQQPLQIAIP